MSVFNSLGSNYNLEFVFDALLATNNNTHSTELESWLENKYGGKAILFYKGRDAIEATLKILHLPENSIVAINGFTCYAVYKAIADANYKTDYIDIEDSDFNFSPKALKAKLDGNSNIKALVIQNTLGYPCSIEEIAGICKQKNIILIEDLAHSIGAKYKNKEAGTVGDFTVLSFSQDKMIDGISGGALIIRNEKYKNLDQLKLNNLGIKQQLQDRFYPLLTLLVRRTYPLGLGKLLHAVLRKYKLLSQPMGSGSNLTKLPNWYSYLIIKQLKKLADNLKHRKNIASVYAQNLPAEILPGAMIKNITDSTNLRFPILVENRSSLIRYLKDYGVYVSDIWYDSPIAPKKYLHLTDYKNQCPVSEKVSTKILNLPTHKDVSVSDARQISERIDKWLKSQ